MLPDLFVTEGFRDALFSADVDRRWTADPHVGQKVRLLVWVLLVVDHDGDGYPVGRRGARFIRGFDPGANRNDVGVRDLLRGLAGGPRPGGLFNVDRYSREKARRGGRRPRGRATTISDVELPQGLFNRRAQEIEDGADLPLVHAVTGRRYDAKRDRPALIQSAVEAARSRCEPDTPEKTRALIDYLHARSVRSFSERFDRVHSDLVRTAKGEGDPDVRLAAFRTIKQLRLQPLPVYKTTGGTQRLAPHGLTLAGAPKWIRRKVLSDSCEIDMESAQLALVAALWDVPSVRNFLAEGRSIWEGLAEWFVERSTRSQFDALLHGPRLKGLLKRLVYGVCFGMTVENLTRWGNPYAGGPKDKAARKEALKFIETTFRRPPGEVGRLFVEHPVVRDLLEARERKMKAVEAAGGLTDMFGRRYKLGEPKRGGSGEPVDVRSVLAAEAQALEHRAMLGVADVFIDEARRAESTSHRTGPEARILLWQADGVSIKVRQKDRWPSWVERADAGLQKALREIEHEIGCPKIHTRLVVDHEPT